MAVGNKHLGYKEALNAIEVQSPGSKAAFYFGFLERASARFADVGAEEQAALTPCTRCAAPTVAPASGETPVCGFCRLVDKAVAAEPVPVPAPKRRNR